MHAKMIGQFGIRFFRCLPNLRPVKSRLLEQLGITRNGLELARRGALPDRQRRAPIALTRQCPIDVRFQEVAKPSVADMLGQPMNLLIVLKHLRSEEHTSELQSRQYLVCRLLLEKKKNKK